MMFATHASTTAVTLGTHCKLRIRMTNKHGKNVFKDVEQGGEEKTERTVNMSLTEDKKAKVPNMLYISDDWEHHFSCPPSVCGGIPGSHSPTGFLCTRMLSTSCIRVCNHMLAHLCARVCSVPLCCWWLSFRIVSKLSVINVPGRVGPKRYITNRRGGRVQGGGGGRRRMEQERSWSGKRNGEEEKGDGVERGGSIGEEKEKGRQGLFSPGSCYVSHYVSPGHRQHASRQNKRVSLAWHCSYFPILTTGSGRGQAAGWGAGGIVGSGLASKTEKAQGSSTS